MNPQVFIVSRHDYRTSWRANMHFLADAYLELGYQVKFASVGYSILSLASSDHRKNLFLASNQWQSVNDVDCYLWRSTVHPFGRGLGKFQKATEFLFKRWIKSSCTALDAAASTSDLIIVESGISAALIGRIRASAPNAKVIYLVSDLLETIGAHPFIGEQLFRDRDCIDAIAVVARAMAPSFKRFDRPVYFIPHGISKDDFEAPSATPFKGKRNVVTVGSMLFDKAVFECAAEAMPDVDFHLIGAPKFPTDAKNIIQYECMPFKETLPYIQHADVGVAPYRISPGADYLADSSMKLMQYDYLRLPAVCPQFAVGDNPNRYGYQPNDPSSIISAMKAAIEAKFKPGIDAPLSWKEAAQRLASPESFIQPV